ncbi:unnamed protein product [Cylicocyclus nassatus]|uniref:Uncharacterized protein n=1 Tax=Cylicocyclus nassatus TaxID=53992 RepID=A0AA36H6W9_CYLNA|nr:unnamed protein product [Cylicocyclus nassatus]
MVAITTAESCEGENLGMSAFERRTFQAQLALSRRVIESDNLHCYTLSPTTSKFVYRKRGKTGEASSITQHPRGDVLLC